MPISEVRSITAKLCWWGVAGGLVFAAGLVLVRGVLAPVFTPDAEVQQLLVRLLLMLALITPIGGIVFVLDGVLVGAGDARYLAFAGMVAPDAARALRARSDAWMRPGA